MAIRRAGSWRIAAAARRALAEGWQPGHGTGVFASYPAFDAAGHPTPRAPAAP